MVGEWSSDVRTNDKIINKKKNKIDKKNKNSETIEEKKNEEKKKKQKTIGIELKIEKLDILKNAVSAGIEINKRKG